MNQTLQQKREIRDIDRQSVKAMRHYIFALRGHACEHCGAYGCDIHHKKYSLTTKLDDLEVLCESCHKNKSNYVRLDYDYRA